MLLDIKLLVTSDVFSHDPDVGNGLAWPRKMYSGWNLPVYIWNVRYCYSPLTTGVKGGVYSGQYCLLNPYQK